MVTLRKDKMGIDEKVFGEIYDAYSDQLFYYIYAKIGDEKQSEDILQDVFVEFWNKRLEVKHSVYGFLFQITKYHILNHFRSIKVRQRYIIHLSTYLQEINTITPHKYVEAKEIMDQIEKLVQQLPPQCRKVFVLSRFEHKSNDEISQLLKISKRTVENYITKSLAFIRDHNISIYLIVTIFMDE